MATKQAKNFIALAVVLTLGLIGAWIGFGGKETGNNSGSGGAATAIPKQADPKTAPKTSDTDKQSEVTGPQKPAFDLVRISRNGTGIIVGSSAPGAAISLYGDGKKIAEGVAEGNGDWIIMLNEPLAPGTIKFSVMSQKDGGDLMESEKEVTVSVPNREKSKFLSDKKSGVVALLSRKDGKGPSKVLQRPGGPVFDDVGESLSISTLEYGAGKTFVNGKSLPRVDVRVYMDDEFMGSVRASDDGDWLLELDSLNLAIGQHRLRVDQTIGDGSVKLRIEQPFVTGVPLDPSKAENGVIVEPGNTLWNIARQLYGSGVQYTMIFQENSEKIADPDKIYPGQLFKLPSKKDKQ